MKFALISLGLLFLLIIWLFIDFTLGRRKHLLLVKKIETPILTGDFEIFTNGEKLFADYLKELKNAKKHIYVLFYIVKDDTFSREFFQLLTEKAREGIEVRLLVDRIGSIEIKRAAIKALRAAGVKFAFSNPIKLPFLFYSAQVRNHRKISIIDGAIGYLGGFNIGNEYINKDPKLCPWHDYHLKITGGSLPYLEEQFLLDWQEPGTREVPKNTTESPKGSIRHQLKATDGAHLEETYIKLFQEAQESIIIGSPYFIPSHRIFHELLQAAKRGIEISIVVPLITDHLLVQEASFRYFRALLKEGAAVFQFNQGFYHGKTIIIDRTVCDIGTANFDNRSLFLNKEINCYIYDSEFIERMMEILRKDMLNSKVLSLAELNKPNPFRSFKEWIAGAISFFL